MPIRFFKRLALNAAAIFLLIVAALFHQEQLYLMSATLFLIPLVAQLLGRAMMGGLACERTGPATCSEGERVTLTLTLTAAGALPKFYLTAQDRLPRWLKPVGDPPALILQLWPGESSAVSYALEPEKRGVYALGPARANTTDPLGFFTYTQTLPCVSELVVYPAVIPLRQLFVLDASGAWGRDGRDDGASRGDGLDFHGVREYRPGDDLRRVHWRTTARTQKLAVMEFVQGQTSDALLALDLNRASYADTGDGPDGALEYAIKTAAAVAAFLLQQGYRVRLLSQGTSLPLRSGDEMPRLLDFLARAQADSPLTLADVIQSDPDAPVGGALIFLTPDAAQPGLGAALSARRTRAFGIVFDRASFRARGGARPAGVEGGDGLLPGIPVQTVRRGDDLPQALEGWSYAGR